MRAATTPASRRAPSSQWGAAPFQLIAIVNRVDLASAPCEAGGELRLIYTALDPVLGEPSNMTLIVRSPTRRRAPRHSGRAPGKSSVGSRTARATPEKLAALAREVRANADPLRVRVLTSEIRAR